MKRTPVEDVLRAEVAREQKALARATEARERAEERVTTATKALREAEIEVGDIQIRVGRAQRALEAFVPAPVVSPKRQSKPVVVETPVQDEEPVDAGA